MDPTTFHHVETEREALLLASLAGVSEYHDRRLAERAPAVIEQLVTSLEEAKQEAKDAVEAHEAELDTLRTELDTLRTELRKAEDRADDLEIERNAMSDDVTSLRQDAERLRGILIDASEGSGGPARRAVEEQLAAAAAANEALWRDAEEAERLRLVAIGERDLARAELAKKHKRAAKSVVDTLRAELAARVADLDGERALLATLREEHAAELAAAREDIDRLAEELDAARREHLAATSALSADLAAKVKQAQSTARRLADERDRMVRERNAAEARAVQLYAAPPSNLQEELDRAMRFGRTLVVALGEANRSLAQERCRVSALEAIIAAQYPDALRARDESSLLAKYG